MELFKAVFLAAVTACIACGKSSTPSADTAHPAAAPPVAGAARPSGPCPPTGEWAICSLEKRMKSAGLVARRITPGTVARAGFSAKPVSYALGRDSRLDVFFYRDEQALARDVAKLDTLHGVPFGAAPDTASPPVWIRSANVAALLFTHDPREADRVSLAITAGPPQPAR